MLGRLSALATLAMMLACGADPAPLEVKKPMAERGSDEARTDRKRQTAEERRRQEQEEADAREREERKERMRKRQAEEAQDAQDSSEPQEKRVAESDEPAASDDPDEQERRARKERIRQREEEEAREAARIARADEKKSKREAAREAKLAKAEAEKAKKTKRKNVEEVDDSDDADESDEVANKTSKAKKDVEGADEADEFADKKSKAAESDEDVADDGGSKASPFKKKPRKQTAAEKKTAAKKLAAEKAAEKKAAEKQAAADKAAERKAAADAKKQAAADKKAAEKQAVDKTDDEDVASEDVADEADAAEERADEAKPKQVANKRKAKAKAKAKTDEVDESEIEVDTASLPPPDPSEESNELDLTAGTPTREEEPVVVAPKLYAIDRRPLTLGRGKIDVHGGLVATAVTASNGMGGTTTASAQGLALGATYGIGAKGELGIDYTLGLHPGDAQGPFMLHGAYVAKHTEKLDIALSLGLAFDFVDSIDPGTMMTTTRTAKAIQVGVWARYHLGAKLSAFSGLPALPSSAGNLGASAPLPPIPYQLSIGLSSVDAIALDLPAGLGYQATPKLYTFAVLDLAHLGMNNTTSALIFSDFIPLSLGGFYAASKMDVGAVFSDDLSQGADYLRFDVVVRYSIK
jgi:hypothetical protein